MSQGEPILLQHLFLNRGNGLNWEYCICLLSYKSNNVLQNICSIEFQFKNYSVSCNYMFKKDSSVLKKTVLVIVSDKPLRLTHKTQIGTANEGIWGFLCSSLSKWSVDRWHSGVTLPLLWPSHQRRQPPLLSQGDASQARPHPIPPHSLPHERGDPNSGASFG